MNFLAHLYLSGNDNEIKIGNFIADSVKGKAHQNYSPKIQQGILLHRKIDEFTDKHRITKELSLLLKSNYNRHSGVVVDIFYDHFLSYNWTKYSDIPLINFINHCYKILLKNIFILPANVRKFLPIMIAQNRLLSYSNVDGLENALKIMARHTSLPSESNFAIEVLNSNFQHINRQFIIFFDELIVHVDNEIKVYENQNFGNK
jgi:acyl carrier protein phosphodiesterase